jgi:hypothetical protein
MGFFSWFKNSAKAEPTSAPSSELNSSFGTDQTHPLRAGSNQPLSGSSHARSAAALSSATASARSEQRRTERNARRELLFQVVRESMTRVGVLSSNYKFKVLALDQRGRQFLVMVDLASEFTSRSDKLAEVEALIAQTAKTRYELVVQAVYWRFYEKITLNSQPTLGAHSGPAPLSSNPISRPAPLGPAGGAPASRPAPLMAVPASRPPPLMAAVGARPGPLMAAPQSRPAPLSGSPLAVSSATSREPLQHDEIEAFKRALAAAGVPPDGPGAASARPSLAAIAAASARASADKINAANVTKAASLAAIHNKLLLTGFEDTEMHDDKLPPELSGTQYGELRQ